MPKTSLTADQKRFDRMTSRLRAALEDEAGFTATTGDPVTTATHGEAVTLGRTGRRDVVLELWYDRYLDFDGPPLFSVWLRSRDARLVRGIAAASGRDQHPPRRAAHRRKNDTLIDGIRWIGKWFVDLWHAQAYFGVYTRDQGHRGYSQDITLEALTDAACTLLSLCATTATGTEDDVADPEFPTSGEDVLDWIARRRGHDTFRKRVRKHFNNRCVVTDCDVVDLLEAAHIVPWAAQKSLRATDGLLLRADIHTLFDRGLLTIVLEKGVPTVKLDRRIRRSVPYKSYQGPVLRPRLLTPDHRSALERRRRGPR